MRGPPGRRGFAAWAAATALLLAAGVAVPYGLLSGGETGFGIAGFWLGFGLAAAALILAGVRRWRD